MKKIAWVLFVLSVLMSFAAPLTADDSSEFYQYVDQNGVRHFTEFYTDIPDQYKSQVKVHKSVPASVPEPVTPETAPSPEMTFKELSAEKITLDEEFASLQARKKEIEAIEKVEDQAAFNQRVNQLNNDIKAFQERREAFNQKAETYNRRVDPTETQ